MCFTASIHSGKCYRCCGHCSDCGVTQPTAGLAAWGLAESGHVGPGMVGWGVPYLQTNRTSKPSGATSLQGATGGP